MAEYVTVAEAITQSSYSHVHIVYLVRNQKIKGRKSGNVWLVDLESLKDYESKMAELGSSKHNPIKSN